MNADISAHDIAGRLALHRTRRGHRGTCPICRNDTLELRQREGKASLVCFYGCDGAELRRAAAGGAILPQPTSPVKSDFERTASALRIWRGAAPLHPALAAYCAYRCLPGLEASGALRWRPDVRHPDAEGMYPAVIALVQDVTGAEIAIHRTFTRRDGAGKADLDPVKASKGPLAGGAVRLDAVAPEIVIAEGIETSAAAGRLLSLPAWAAINAGNLERTLQLPPEVRRVVVASDPDPVGQRAADGAARRWMSEGRLVRIILPTGAGDFADVWARRAGEHG